MAELVKTRDALTMEENFTMKGIRTRTLLAMLRFRLASYQPDGTPRAYAMGVRERFEPIDSPLLARGELESPGESVPRGLIELAGSKISAAVVNGSGRLELAQWVASRQNPLTARVMANRVWLHLFGRGLVATPDDFGAAGQAPDHPELLDTLAVSFMDHGWSVKQLIRQIVLSRAYQLASTHDARNFEADPDDVLVWRMSKKRLEAEAVRDAVLCASGELIVEPPVGSAVALAGEGVVGPNRRFNQDGQNLHRAVYLPVVRDQVPESLAIFDFPDPSLVTGQRARTSGPSQALYLMNNPFVIRQAEAAGQRVRSSCNDAAGRVKTAYVRFLSRYPTATETAQAREFLAQVSRAEKRRRPGPSGLDCLLPGASTRPRNSGTSIELNVTTTPTVGRFSHVGTSLHRVPPLGLEGGVFGFRVRRVCGALVVRGGGPIARRELAPGAQGTSLSGEGQAGDFSVHARGAVARRHV